jgi:hypothetical protein
MQSLYPNQRLWFLIRLLMILGVVFVLVGLYVDYRFSFIGGVSMREVFWMILMPAVVLCMYFSPMLWRNSCPLSTVSLWRFILFGRRKLTLMGSKANELTGFHGKLQQLIRKRGLVISALLFWVIVPYRLVLFNADSMGTFWLIVGVFTAAFVFGALFPVKSGWCTSICPIAAAEKVYGMNPAFEVKNNRCHYYNAEQKMVMTCSGCSFNCSDVVEPEHAYWQQALDKVFHATLNAEMRKIFVATLPGFMIMFFLLANKIIALPKDFSTKVIFLYGWVALGMIISFMLYVLVKKLAWQNIIKITEDAKEREVAYAIAKRKLDLFVVTASMNVIVFATTYTWTFVLMPKIFGAEPIRQAVAWTILYFTFFFISFFGLRSSWHEKPGPGNYRPHWW